MPESEVVVITGASSGIGRATVRRFAGPGVSIALIARNREGLEGARREVEEAGGRALVLPIDITDPDAVESAAQATEEALGPIDIWINDAMATVFAYFWDIEPEEFKRSTESTYYGSVWGIKAALKRMRERDRGTIVQVGSAMAYRGIPLQSPYCGAKHALLGLFESLRCELINTGSNVHLTMVQLPGINTPQFEHARDKFETVSMPVPPVYQPEVAADAIHFAAHHRRREIYVGIPTLYTVWGNKVAPWLVDLYLGKSGVKGQLTDNKKDPDRQDNLFEAPPGDPGAHGPYDEKAHSHSVQLWATKHKFELLGGLAAGAAAGVAALVARD